MKSFNNSLIITAAIFGLLLIFGFSLFKSYDLNQYKAELAAQIEAISGRKLSIAGALKLQIAPGPRITLNDVTLANADWSSRAEMIFIQRLTADVAFIPLLQGKIEVTQLTLEKINLLLEKSHHGNNNWGFINRADQAEVSEYKTLPILNNILIKQAQVTYLDNTTATQHQVVIDLLQTSSNTLQEPTNLLFKGELNNTPVKLSGSILHLPVPINGGTLQLDLTASVNGITTSVKSTGYISPDQTQYQLDQLLIRQGESHLSGRLSVDLRQQRPRLKAQLVADLLDLRPLINTGQEEADKKAEKMPIFSNQPLPIEMFQALDGQVAFNTHRLTGTGIEINDLQINLQLERGIVQLESPGLQIANGNMQASLVLNTRKNPAGMVLSASAEGVDLGKLLRQTGVSNLIDHASGRFSLQLSGRGNSIKEMAGSLNGTAMLSVDDGKIDNRQLNIEAADLLSQLVNALNPFAGKAPYTRLKCAVVNLRFDNGISRFDRQVAMETDHMNIVSSGEIDLRKQVLDMKFTPLPGNEIKDLGIGAADLVTAARVHGPLDKPSLGLDAAGTAKTGLKIYGAIATGGASLLIGGLLNKITADDTPCLSALGRKQTTPRKIKVNREESLFFDR